MAVESFCIPYVTDALCENLSNYEEFRLHGTCIAVYHGNRARRQWLMRLHEHIHALYHRQRSQNERMVDENALHSLRLSMEAIAVHNSRMGNNEEKWQHMPGETVEQKWDYYIHRQPPHNPWNDPVFSCNWATSSKDWGNPQGSM